MEALAKPATDRYINRELSHFEFNKRVLAQALDPAVPLLERLRFLCITSTNLDLTAEAFFKLTVLAFPVRGVDMGGNTRRLIIGTDRSTTLQGQHAEYEQTCR